MNAPADVSVPGYYLAAAIEAMGNANFLDDIREHKTEYLFSGSVGQVFGEQSALLAEEKVSVKDAALTVLNAYYKERKLKHSYGLDDNTTEKYKDYDKPITLDDIKNLRVLFTERKSINDFTSEEIAATQKWAYKYFKQMGTKSPFFRAWFGDWRAYDKTSITIAEIPEFLDDISLKNAIASQRISEGIENLDTKSNIYSGWAVRISGEGTRNTLSHSNKDMKSYYGLTGIRELIKNSILLETQIHEHHSNNSKSITTDNIIFDHRLYVLGKDATGSINLYRITVEEKYQDKKHPDDMRFHNLKYIEKVAENIAGSAAKTDHSSRYDVSTTGYTIADLYSLVKQYDKDFTAGKPVSEYVLNEDGTPKVFYHGTNSGGFDEFDKNKIGSATDEGIWGKGFYFSSHKGTSQNYGKNIMQVYLALKNPLVIEDNSTDISELADKLDMWEGNFRKYGENIRISQSQTGQFVSHLLDNGFDSLIIKHSSDDEIVVFNSDYIKSATDNIGTFDGSTGKIKNSYALSEAEDSEDMDSYIDNLTEKQYNNFGWIRANNIITQHDYKTLLSRYADFKHNKDVYPVTRFGEAVISSTEAPGVVMYVKGSITNPTITKVVTVNTENSIVERMVSDEIIKGERERALFPLRIVENMYGTEILGRHTPRDYGSYREFINGRRERESLGDVAETVRTGRDGETGNRGSETDNSEVQIKRSYALSEAEDSEYMELAKEPEKNEERLNELVSKAARKAMPNSKITDEDGNLLVVYHGTEENFTVFDRTKGRANMDIQGMFFSPWEIDAGGYGGKVGAYYLNIVKPASESVGYKALNMFKEQNSAGVKAREYLIALGYDGVNNGDEEYIAFYSNQIKSADTVTYDDNGNIIPLSERFNEKNEDIRYSYALGGQGNGYDGYSMSNNAREAYEDGEMPLSKWNKSNILAAVAELDTEKVQMLKKCSASVLKDHLLLYASWHHTSSHYNRTDFYKINEDMLELVDENTVNEWMSEEKQQKKEPDKKIFKGDIDYLEWGGSRTHPKATKHTLTNVNIEEKGSFYIVTDDNGNELLKKKIGSNGTYVRNYAEIARQEALKEEWKNKIRDNSTEEAFELYSSGDYTSYSSSRHIYKAGRKPSGYDYDRGLDKFFSVGEKRLAPNADGGYYVETWTGEGWNSEDFKNSYALGSEEYAEIEDWKASNKDYSRQLQILENVSKYAIERTAKVNALKLDDTNFPVKARQVADTFRSEVFEDRNIVKPISEKAVIVLKDFVKGRKTGEQSLVTLRNYIEEKLTQSGLYEEATADTGANELKQRMKGVKVYLDETTKNDQYKAEH